ncbi:MAG: sigma 54-interacting transcriptional regulator [Kofleriaceae bacterium]
MTEDGKTLRREPAGRRVRKLSVTVTSGVDANLESPAVERCAIGSASDNELVLRDPEVSRYHLELVAGEHGILVKDLGSLNGTHLANTRIVEAILQPGTKLVAGSTTLIVNDAGTDTKPATMTEVPSIIGRSSAIREVASDVAQLAKTAVSTLIHGETGTGKEVIARAIHELGSRRDKPFVVVDCGSMPATLIASELFGHERGAFTGADQRHVGAFEQADGGTLFLDEIGELPLAVQPSLLGALERRRFRRVGGQKEIAVDVRVIAATHRDLRSEANRGTFRPDLYFRLAVARVVIPALRQRREDIEPLVAHFVEQATGQSDVSRYFGPASLDAMRQHPWSGNVRELRNVVERALALGQLQLDTAQHAVNEGPLPSYKDARASALSEFEKTYLTRLMSLSTNNASEAARRAAMDRPYLLSLLKKHSLR